MPIFQNNQGNQRGTRITDFVQLCVRKISRKIGIRQTVSVGEIFLI